jgi:hypothetical protein
MNKNVRSEMDCQKIKDLTLDYLDNELSPESRKAFEDHLEGCEACLKEVEELSASWEMLESFEVAPVSKSFEAEVLDKVNQLSNKDEKSLIDRLLQIFAFNNFATVPALASILVLLVLGVMIYRNGPSGIVDPEIKPTDKIKIVRNLKDEEIIRNLHIYEEAGILENLDLLVDMEVAENLELEEK